MIKPAILILLIISMSLYLCFGPAGHATQSELRAKIQTATLEIARREREVAQLDCELKRWEREPLFMIEKVAREEYDYARRDELVFLVELH